MRNIFAIGPLGLIAGVCAGATPAQASSYTVRGAVPSGCAVANATPLLLSTVVGTNGKLDSSLNGKSWTISGLSCNAASRITVTAKALRITTPKTSLPTGHSQTINFTAAATGWTTTAATVTTGETTSLGTGASYTGAAQIQSTPRAASITVTVNNFVIVGQAGNSNQQLKPTDGTYNATITITLSASN